MNNTKEFENLAFAIIEDRATDEERATFSNLLKQDPAARREFAEQLRIHAFLTWQHGRADVPPASLESDLEAAVAPSMAPEAIQKKILTFPRRTAAVAAALVALLAGVVWLTYRSGTQGVGFEVLTASGVDFQQGESVVRDRLDMAGGALTFRLTNGVVIEARGPVSLELLDPMRLRILSGSVTADAGASGKGFTIETSSARVVDLGTRFAVGVNTAGDTDVAVFDGEVEVYKPEVQSIASNMLANLKQGEAVRVDRTQGMRRLAAVSLRDGALAIMDGNPGKSVVTSVTDNISTGNSNRFYAITPGGMKPGVRAYSTLGTPRWQSMPDAAFPEEILGADVIGTFPDDRRDADLHLTLDITRPATVYLLLDTRAPVPDWVKRRFTTTPMQLRCGPWTDASGTTKAAQRDDNGVAWVHYEIWRAEAPAGPFELGPPFESGNARKLAMYGVAVKARP